MRINNNIMALNAHRQLGANQAAGARSMERLSSGLRINRAGDDAAGLAISEKMRGQIRGLKQASRNAQDGISLIQTAEGALNETHAILQRMRELAAQAANDTNVDVDRKEIQKEMNQLTSEINRIGNTTEFNTQKLLNGGGVARTSLSVENTSAPGASVGAVGEVELVEGSYQAGSDAQAAQFTFELTANFEAGESISVGGRTYTFGSGEGEVEVGVDVEATAANLAAAIAADEANLFTASAEAGEITLTQRVAADPGDPVTTPVISIGTPTNGAVGDVTYVEGSYADAVPPTAAEFTFSVSTNFAEGDTIEVGGQTYTFGDGEGGTVAVGGDIETSVANLVDAINGDGDNAFTAAAGSDNESIVLTQKSPAAGPAPEITLGGTSYKGELSAVEYVAGSYVDGVSNAAYEFTITENFAAGDTITIGDKTYTFGDGSEGTVAIGGSAEATAANLAAAINDVGDPNGEYSASEDSGVITLTRTDNTDPGADPADLVFTQTGTSSAGEASSAVQTEAYDAGSAAQGAQFTLTLTENFSAGESITIAGETYTFGSEPGQIAIGDDPDPAVALATTAANLAAAISGDYTATSTGATITLTQATPSDPGETTPTVSTSGADPQGAIGTVEYVADSYQAGTDAQEAQFTLSVTENFVEGESIEIGGRTYTFGSEEGQVAIGEDAAATAENLAGAITADLEGAFTAAAADGVITLTQRVAADPGEDVPNVEVSGAESTPGTYSLTMEEMVSVGGSIVIDGVSIEVVEEATEEQIAAGTHINAGADLNEQVANLRVAINNNESLGYVAGGEDAEITLTQETASSTGPVVSTLSTRSEYTATLQIGANTGQSFRIDIRDMRATALGIGGAAGSEASHNARFTEANSVTNGTTSELSEAALDVSTHENATAALSVLDKAIEEVSAERSKLGSFQNRLEHTISNLGTSAENLQAAESRVRDLDMAAEMMEFTKNNILQQAATAMLAQANMAPQSVLQLLG